MRLILLLLSAFLIIIGSALALDLDEYPEPFVSDGSFEARIVVGAASPAGDILAATTMATSLQLLVQGERLTALLDNEIINAYAENLILIGDCQNTLIAEVKGLGKCYQDLPATTGVIELLYYNDVSVLIVGGKDPDGRRKAAAALAKYEDFYFEGQTSIITGTLNFPQVENSATIIESDNGVEVMTVVVEPEETPSLLCGSDDDCNLTQFCSQYGCLPLECPTGFSVINHTCDREVREPAKILVEVTPDVDIPAPQNINFIQEIINWIKGLFS